MSILNTYNRLFNHENHSSLLDRLAHKSYCVSDLSDADIFNYDIIVMHCCSFDCNYSIYWKANPSITDIVHQLRVRNIEFDSLIICLHDFY